MRIIPFLLVGLLLFSTISWSQDTPKPSSSPTAETQKAALPPKIKKRTITAAVAAPAKPAPPVSPANSDINYRQKIDQLLMELKVEIARLTQRSEQEEAIVTQLAIPEPPSKSPAELAAPAPELPKHAQTIVGLEAEIRSAESSVESSPATPSTTSKDDNLLASPKGLKMGSYEVSTAQEKKEQAQGLSNK